jgi:hypothetical protein
MAGLKNMRLVAPCANCPFRSDVPRYLANERYADIAQAIIDRGESFICHKTVSFDDDGRPEPDGRNCHCAGAMIFLQHLDRPNQAMQVMERLGAFDPSTLQMDAPVYRARAEFENSGDGTSSALGVRDACASSEPE